MGGPAAIVAARSELGPPDRAARFWRVAAHFFGPGRPNLARGPPDLAAGRPWWRPGGPPTRYGRFHQLPDTGS